MIVIRKIAVENVRPGMIIAKTDKSGINFPYYGMPLPNIEAITILVTNGVREVYIKQEVAEDYIASPEGNSEQEQPKAEESFEEHAAKPVGKQVELDRMDVSINAQTLEEIEYLKVFYDKARENTRDLLEKFRFSGNIDLKQAVTVINELVSLNTDSPAIALTLATMRGVTDYLFEHSLNVCLLSIALGKRMNFSVDELKVVGLIGLLHDSGMLNVPPAIVNKPGTLTPREFEFIKKHPINGYEMLRRNKSVPQSVLVGVLQHHEKIDGSGYPNGMQDKQISKFAKVVAIVDAFDAMTSDRVYTKGMPPSQALKFIYNNAGTHYDEAIVKFFVSLIGIYPVGTLVMLDTGELAVVYAINKDNPTRPKVLIVTDEKRKATAPALYDLAKYHLVTKNYYKKILSPMNPKLFRFDVKKIIDDFVNQRSDSTSN